MDFEKNKSKDIKEEKKPIYSFDFTKNKYLIYFYVFYAFGLFIGAYFYKTFGSESINNVLKISNDTLRDLFFSSLIGYVSVFLICAFLGFCLISKPIINILPFIIGVFYGCRISYYYICHGYKGVVFSIIMIIPFISAFLSVLSYVIKESVELSDKLIKMTKGEELVKIEVQKYLKKYLIYFVIIIVLAFASSAITKLLLCVVTI